MTYLRYFFALLLLSAGTCAQTTGDGKFGCDQTPATFFEDPGLKLVELNVPEKIKEWQGRPALRFQGFTEQKYGFTEVTFFRWHVTLKERKGASLTGLYEDRLELAVLVKSTRGGQRWFELEHQKDSYGTEDLLYIQPDAGSGKSDDDQAETGEQDSGDTSKKAVPGDEMSQWLALHPATPEPGVPLFLLSFSYSDRGANAGGTMDNQLLLDLRDGTPKVVRAVQCTDWEGGGACGAPDYSASAHDNLNCSWEKTAGDFRCTLVGDYGQGYGPRTAQKDFYLVSGKRAIPDWQKPDTPADLAAWAARLHINKASPAVAKIPGIGQTALLKRYADLAPGSEVMIFASPADTPSFGERLWLAVVPQSGQPAVSQIPLWLISGEELKQGKAGGDYTPSDLTEIFSVNDLEQRSGFRAIQVTAAIMPSPNAVHVLYWVGLEAANGTVTANAVRVASEASQYAHCGQELHDGTAISLARKPGLAEATLLVRPQDPEQTGPDETDTPCAWNAVLHWKTGSGFRVRKLTEDCKASTADVKISDDGNISLAPQPAGQK